ncbi:MAG: GNAT family N-acetyltransferase [Bacteroides sp.]|nr:GNAT family N-acetyltransferase [Eubacterium sp.]MCM1417771.1 GNAT family N-acetyltransferase [Roseburia sp.]MCM1461338.1 GNAT family N-acetyltransferase [Bacteroides sp.]
MNSEKAFDLALRKAKERDFPLLIALYRSAVGSPGLPWTEDYPSIDHIRGDYASGALYVLTRGGEPIGAVSALPSEEGAETRELSRIAVARDFRRKGYAKEMLRLLFAALSDEGCQKVALYVAVGNEAAIRLYRSLGFSFLGRTSLPDWGGEFYACERVLEPSPK